jgi:hypothetical protein
MARVVMDPGFAAEVIPEALAFMDERLGPSIADDARLYAPVGPSWGYTAKHPRVPPHEGGELKASIEHHMEGADLIVEAHAPYAAYVELGTSPHPINATGFGTNPRVWRSHDLGERTLWSLWSPVGDRYFGPHVDFPGSRPYPYLRPALYRYRTE